MELKTKLLSSLEKVFLKGEPVADEYLCGSALKGEEYSFQLAYLLMGGDSVCARVEVESEISNCVSVYRVENVPSELPAYPENNDPYYITTEPGLFPDPMLPLEDGLLCIRTRSWYSLWFSVKIPESIKGGEYSIKIKIIDANNEVCVEKTFTLKVVDAVLPPQKLILTQWFHTDCIADFYKLPCFSEKHWELIGKFMRIGAEHGLSLILTPIFTPPLDTAIGGERTTVQLVGVKRDGERYTFDFSKLGRWIDLARENGIFNFEMAHLFTQWGGEHAPKIIATVDGVEKKLFGWETDSIGEEYTAFLQEFLPQLSAYIKSKGAEKNTFFHISDEPNAGHLEHYAKIRKTVGDALHEEYPIMDALSSYDFYEKGVLKNPIPATNHIKPFLEHNVPNLWTYYCCGQCVNVGNRFMSMPAYRNRILGLQLYKFKIAGFLQWGFNFYNSRQSWFHINPFLTTDAFASFPSGDSFSVYPGEDGPLPSTRIKVFANALHDMRALSLLETLMPRDEIIKKLDERKELRFDDYPHSAEWLLAFREWVNKSIEERI